MVYPVCSALRQNCLKDFTQFAFWGFSIAYPPRNHLPHNVMWPTLGYVMEYRNFQASMVPSKYHTSVMKITCPSNSSSSIISRLHCPGALQISVEVGEAPGVEKHCPPKHGHDLGANCTLNEEVMQDNPHDCSKSSGGHKIRKRRKKVHGNKGKVPWNKGRKHTSETRALIKQRTIEAMRDPQVKKKMTEHPRTHSDEIKKKIGSSLRRLWDKRLKWEKLREKFFLSWTKSIAESARKGGIKQKKLNWDSYDKMKEKIIQQQLQCTIDKAKAKKLAKMRAEKAAQAKVEKMAKLAQRRKEREEKAKAREDAKRKGYIKSKNNTVRQLTLKQKLTKIRKKKSINGPAVSQGDTLLSQSPAWKKLDLEIMKGEKDQIIVSLADQIQAAKNKRTEPSEMEALAEPYTDNSFARTLLK
ncbi:uncharacterized protein [Euphorbia lathyris]|uniref:uncharacterized protein n=1 Tax=Euphorbia lathyris TaxID=212925 RepID=UPI00331319B1